MQDHPPEYLARRDHRRWLYRELDKAADTFLQFRRDSDSAATEDEVTDAIIAWLCYSHYRRGEKGPEMVRQITNIANDWWTDKVGLADE
jgi:hypothetical protein